MPSRQPQRRRSTKRRVGRPLLGAAKRDGRVQVHLTLAAHAVVQQLAAAAKQSESSWGQAAFERAIRASIEDGLLTPEEAESALRSYSAEP
jgi:hypothetical protein